MMLTVNASAPCQELSSILTIACGSGRRMPTDADLPTSRVNKAAIANRMESFWIRVLHDAFRDHYAKHPEVVTLSKAYRDLEWRRNEFLHDLTVLERRSINSAYLERPLRVAGRVLWQVGSELSGPGREVAIDFSKLVAGSAESKLLIVRQPVERQSDGQAPR